MAKLNANGEEVARLTKGSFCISLRKHPRGAIRILRKIKIDRGWSEWKRWFELETHFNHPGQEPADAIRFLVSRGYTVEGNV